MATFTQAEIDALISCPKRFTDAPKKEMKLDGSHRSNDARLAATDGTKGVFSLFIREHIDWPENFSAGLTYNPQDGRQEITLIRCNGSHGTYNRGNNDFDPSHPHWTYHVHRATQEALDSGLSAEKNATRTSEFASLKEAVQYLVKEVGLDRSDIAKHFYTASQTALNFGDA